MRALIPTSLLKIIHRLFEDIIFSRVPSDYTTETSTPESAFNDRPPPRRLWCSGPKHPSWPWSRYNFKVNSFGGFLFTILFQSPFKVFSYGHKFSQTGSQPPIPFFCLFINPLTSGHNPSTNRVAIAGWVTSPIVWNAESCRKSASRWALKSVTDSSFFCLHVWITDQRRL